MRQHPRKCYTLQSSYLCLCLLIHHDKGIVWVDFFFSVQELLDIEGVLGVIIGGVLVVRVLGQVVFVRKERSDATKLQDALAAIQHRQFIPAHKLPAVKSSDEFAKEKTLPVKKREGSL